MSVLQATTYDLIEILYLVKVCVREMNYKGWLHYNLPFDSITNDIDKGHVFLFKKNGVTLGMVTLEVDAEAEYKNVSWNIKSSKPITAHRLTVHPNWKNQNIENEILQFIEQFARIKAYTSIRIDAYAEDIEAITVYNNLQYSEAGQIQFHYQKVPFTCFEKLL